MGYKNLSFHTDFRNLHMTLVKSVPKKRFLGLSSFSSDKTIFWLNVLGALFTKVICTFFKSVRKDGVFDAPLDLFKEKSVHLLEGTIENLKGPKWKEPLNISKRFLKTDLRFSLSFPGNNS